MLTACQRDARLRAGRSTVLRVEPAGEGRWTALLDDSILYAEGGGQPWDLGTVGGVEVVAVRKAAGGVAHELVAPVPLGEADVALDWARRFDHMQQHTAQHLLSALALGEQGLATTSFHLHPGLDAVCDVELAGEVDAPRLMERVNDEVRAARAVRVVLADADALPEGVRSRGLPEGLEGPVRLVEIDGLDLNTCGGTHVASTAELQAVALLGTERIRGGTRVSFVAGGRVLARLLRGERQLAEAGALLSRAPDDVVEGVRRALDDGKAAGRARDAATAELAAALGAALVAEAGPVWVLHRSDGDAAFLNRIAGEALRARPDAALVLTAEPDVFLVAAPAPALGAAKAEILALLEARGGGPPGRLQGRAVRLDRRAEVVAVLSRRIGHDAR